jgi:hypothetical protein
VAAELLYWVNNRVFDSLVVYTAIPLLLIGINSFDVKVRPLSSRHTAEE